MHRLSMRPITLAALAACSLLACSPAFAGVGPSSSQDSYLVPVPNGPAFTAISIMTAGDRVGGTASGYKMVGVPDGIGAYSNGDGTMTLLVNHELGATSGVVRAHGGTGSFVSRWNIDTTPGANFLKVNSGRDLDDSVQTTGNGAGGSLTTFARYCSSDLAPATAFYNAATGKGTQNRILLNGEENGGASRAMAHVVDVNGANTGVGYQLAAFNLPSVGWENLLAHPGTGDQTLIMADSDGGFNRVYAYSGQKQATGTDVQRAGLVGGTTYGIQVKVGGANVASESIPFALGTTSAVTTGTFTLTPGDSGTTFLRPEDGAWDPVHPNDYYFVTTNQYDQVKDGVGTAAGRTRMWRMTYNDVNNPTAGGSIEAVLDGTEPIQMLDNICVIPGADGHTRILALEDVGGNSHNGKVWLYDATTDQLTMVAKHFASNGDIVNGTSIAATAPFNNDEEFSGILDARDTLGLGWFLLDDQQHFGVSGEQVEGGQLIALYLPGAIPEPTTLAALTGASVVALRRRRLAR